MQADLMTFLISRGHTQKEEEAGDQGHIKELTGGLLEEAVGQEPRVVNQVEVEK